MLSNIISNLIVFEKFVSENEYLRVCVYRVLLRYTGFKLESVRYPCINCNEETKKPSNLEHTKFARRYRTRTQTSCICQKRTQHLKDIEQEIQN